MDLTLYSNNQEKVRAHYGKTQSDIDTDLKILKDWIQKRPHLPTSLTSEDGFLERLLLRNKFSIAKTKIKLENYCTRRLHYGYLFDGCDKIIPLHRSMIHFPPGVQTENLERILFMKVVDEDSYNYKTDVLQVLSFFELMMRYDYSIGIIPIFDLSETTIKIVTKWNLKLAIPAHNMILNAYSERITKVYLVHKVAPTFMRILKPIIPKKLYDKIHCHGDLKSLRKVIPGKYLPEDCGGDLKKVAELQDDWEATILKYRDVLEHAFNTVSNEKLRVDDLSDPCYTATFKKLNID